MTDSSIEKKKWKVRTADQSREISFLPVFEVKTHGKDEIVQASNKEVECLYVDIECTDDKGGRFEMRMNFLDLYMFTYFVANEELRQQLQLRYERQINYIPYETTFKLTPEEMRDGMAKRLIKLTVDDITMGMARSQLLAMKGKLTPESVEQYFARKDHKGRNIIKPN